ncbi:hypothetical protein, partial [Azospira oryzae]|uniref:hypothetical protein n=1 Tax=Azospira oryzae TaxID=146939 RepID=UPI00196532B0
PGQNSTLTGGQNCALIDKFRNPPHIDKFQNHLLILENFEATKAKDFLACPAESVANMTRCLTRHRLWDWQ